MSNIDFVVKKLTTLRKVDAEVFAGLEIWAPVELVFHPPDPHTLKCGLVLVGMKLDRDSVVVEGSKVLVTVKNLVSSLADQIVVLLVIVEGVFWIGNTVAVLVMTTNDSVVGGAGPFSQIVVPSSTTKARNSLVAVTSLTVLETGEAEVGSERASACTVVVL
jgi:hypothetical protein